MLSNCITTSLKICALFFGLQLHKTKNDTTGGRNKFRSKWDCNVNLYTRGTGSEDFEKNVTRKHWLQV
jgi:hypothetical protein